MHGRAFEVKKDKECERVPKLWMDGASFVVSSSALFYKAKVIGTS